jgi:hypothetical protein
LIYAAQHRNHTLDALLYVSPGNLKSILPAVLPNFEGVTVGSAATFVFSLSMIWKALVFIMIAANFKNFPFVYYVCPCCMTAYVDPNPCPRSTPGSQNYISLRNKIRADHPNPATVPQRASIAWHMPPYEYSTHFHLLCGRNRRPGTLMTVDPFLSAMSCAPPWYVERKQCFPETMISSSGLWYEDVWYGLGAGRLGRGGRCCGMVVGGRRSFNASPTYSRALCLFGFAVAVVLWLLGARFGGTSCFIHFHSLSIRSGCSVSLFALSS